MGIRHRGRELAFQVLFQTDQTGDKVNLVLSRFQDLRRAPAPAADFARELAQGAFGRLAELDALIGRSAEHWKLSRLLSVDRALLRLGAFELARRPDVPAEVVLDECIELAKTYGSDESAAFVNGVLDRLAKELRPAGDPGKAPAKSKVKPAARAKASAGPAPEPEA